MKKYYYSIGEVSEKLDLNKPTIRYWEKEFKKKIGKIKKTSGTRRFTNKQVKILERIKELLYIEKYTIEGAKRRLLLNQDENIYKQELQKIRKILIEET